MKKAMITMTALCLTLGAFGCQQRQEQKQQMNLPAVQMPTPMEVEQLRAETVKSPKNPRVWITLGNAMMDSQRFTEAIEAYQKGLALAPKNVAARVDMGTCYRGIGKFDKAVEEYRKAIKIDPKFPTGHRNLGVVLINDLHNTTEGLKEFQKYLELAPNAPDSDAVRKTIQELSLAGPAAK